MSAEMITWEVVKDPSRIYQIAHESPVLYAALQYHFCGDITFEQALMTAVVMLVEREKIFIKERMEQIEREPMVRHWSKP